MPFGNTRPSMGRSTSAAHLLGERVQVVQGRKKQIDVLLDDFERVRNSSGPDGAFQTASFG